MHDWLVFLLVRVASVPLVQTWFVPDEFWQATEVAHHMAFRYGYRTWEWKEGIRGVLYPGVLALLFKILAFLGADSQVLLIHVPRALHAIAFAVGDYHIFRLSKTLYGSGSGGWVMVCLTTSWFLQYCAPRTLTSCVETVLLAITFCHYPWHKEKECCSAAYLLPVGLACVARPTAVVPFLPLALRHLWHSHCRVLLLLKYMTITAFILVLTIGVDSWYYGHLVVVPWKFIHFNVVTGLSSHYGILPWHWYLTQGVPAILTTHLLPLLQALLTRPAMHRDLLPVIVWSLVVYSCLGHKEFRFLLPVLPLCLCVAGEQIAFHLTSHAKRSGRSMRFRSRMVFFFLLVPNLLAGLYLSLVHQRGPLDVMEVIQQDVEVNPEANLLFLMPCHSTPYYSHLHRNITMRFLTCEPNLAGEEHYVDEAELFEQDPLVWLLQEYGTTFPAPSHTTLQGGKVPRVTEKKIKGEINERKSRDMKEENRMGNRTKRELMYSTKQKASEGKLQEERGMGNYMKNKDLKNQDPDISLPSHIVMFSVLSEKVKSFLEAHQYHLCHQVFHSHLNDGRRSQYILVFCR